MDKYYTPDISEFHVGFEYQTSGNDGDDWHEELILDKFELVQAIENDALYIFRVKYLDRGDVESLGFEHDQTTKDGSYFYNGTLITENQWCINLKDLIIDIYDINGKSDFRFTGVIKNKSELKRVLKMIGYEKQ